MDGGNTGNAGAVFSEPVEAFLKIKNLRQAQGKRSRGIPQLLRENDSEGIPSSQLKHPHPNPLPQGEGVIDVSLIQQQSRPRTFFAQRIIGIAQRTVQQRQAPATDAALELITQLGERMNTFLQHVAP